MSTTSKSTAKKRPKFWKKMSPKRRKLIKEIIIGAVSLFIFAVGAFIIWASTLPLPDLDSFDQRKVAQSTKIYDRTGNILLYDVNQDIKRTVVPFTSISPNIKNATIAIEDQSFYEEGGIRIESIVRALLVDIISFHLSQGGSTITQQVIKNTFLNGDKTIARKVEEWVLAIKLEHVLDKDDILETYLNEIPYGGEIYGVEEASEEYFGIPASSVDIAQAAYLASMPESPSYYSPFGPNKAALDARKDLVLQKMLQQGYITQDQYNTAVNEVVVFNQPTDQSIKAPWFVFYVLAQLDAKYGADAVANNGYKVITTLNYDLQAKAETIVNQYALQNQITYNASNASMVAIDPKTGQILVMVGSRNYFDTQIDGQFNETLAPRQPGSSFKPFVYSEAFLKGYTPDTVVFDLPTEFSTECSPESKPLYTGAVCYDPVDYDGLWRGPMTLRDALAQSINVPAIKLLYLAGIADSLTLAKNMGITTLGNPDQYGLTLVLGGGEVTLLDMTSAYADFADEGIRNPYSSILEVDDANGNVLQSYQPDPTQVLDKQVALEITDILDDNVARAPAYGTNSPLYFPGYDVAVKTGTTNDYRDAWVLGYTPDITVGAWAGNNDDTPMANETAHYLVAPMWNQFMQYALQEIPKEDFEKPQPIDESQMKPVFQGIWQGEQEYFVNKNTGLLAASSTPADEETEKVVQNVHEILQWVNKDDPQGPIPTDPSSDPQYALWEYPVQIWAAQHGYTEQSDSVIPTEVDTSNEAQNIPTVDITSPTNGGSYDDNASVPVTLSVTSHFPIVNAQYYLNSDYLGSSQTSPFNFSFTPSQSNAASDDTNELYVVVTDSEGNQGEATTSLTFTTN